MLVDDGPLQDVRRAKPYRAHVVRILLQEGLEECDDIRAPVPQGYLQSMVSVPLDRYRELTLAIGGRLSQGNTPRH